MELNSSLSSELKKVTRALASHKIELYQTRAYLQCILQNSTDMIFATDVGGILVSFSKGGEKILGYSWKEVAGKPIKNFAEDPASFEHIMAKCQEDNYALALDVPFRHKEGEKVFCHVSLISLTNREGQRVGTVGVCRDITQWKKFQENLVRVDRLAEMGRMAAGVAHEINNPVAIISEASGWAHEVISDAKGLNPEDRKELEDVITKISEQTTRCRSITHKLLTFARDSPPAKTDFDLHGLIKHVISFLAPDLKHTSIQIELNFTSKPVLLNSDPRLLEQVFVNFLTNAIHAILEKKEGEKRIEIRTLKTNSEIEISFIDSGVGIPEEDQGKIFDLFYSTKPPGKGTGLGLPICQNIVRNLEGEITFESKVGVGSTFTVRLPIS